jgi:rRNA maturation RNase YbeY
MDISFAFPAAITLLQRKQLRKFIGSMVELEGNTIEALSFVFCSDDFLLQINRDFLSHDYYTDIITFDFSDDGSGAIAGEIYISVDTVRENARSYSTSITRELHRVIFHGILHLCGYKDKTKSQKHVMRQKEDYYLNQYFPVPRGTIRFPKS